MRQFFFFLLILGTLLGGCASRQEPVQPETVPEAAPVPEDTTVEVSIATEPYDPLQMLLDSMTTEEKVGQLFLARCPDESAAEDIRTYHLGGYILFGRDFDNETPESFSDKIQRLQLAAPIPLLIAVDEEGGSVCRISSHTAFRSRRFPSPREAFASGGMEEVLAVETEKAALLRSLNINVNMGPVCDVTTDPQAFMYQRSLGQSPEETGRFAVNTVRIMESQAIGTVLKHFPGYGNNADTHTQIARDERSLEELEKTDLVPFDAAMETGADAVLVSHTIVAALDETLPASLSPAVHDYLRNAMNFDGVIVTDDLVMQAITDAYGPEEAAVLAVLGGNDLLCSTQYQLQYAAVLKAVQEGRISETRLEESVLRILRWKKELGLIF